MCKHCWDDDRTEHHKDFIRGGVSIEDFEDEPQRQRTAGKSKRKSRVRKTRAGCPGNDNGPHVYVYTTEGESDSFFLFYGYHRFERKVCCGCSKTTWGKRPTARYARWKDREWYKRYGGEFSVTRGEPVARRWRYDVSYNYFAPEKDDVEFMNFHRDRMQKAGMPTWYYGW